MWPFPPSPVSPHNIWDYKVSARGLETLVLTNGKLVHKDTVPLRDWSHVYCVSAQYPAIQLKKGGNIIVISVNGISNTVWSVSIFILLEFFNVLGSKISYIHWGTQRYQRPLFFQESQSTHKELHKFRCRIDYDRNNLIKGSYWGHLMWDLGFEKH